MLMNWEDSYRSAMIELWNAEAVKDGYKELTDASYKTIFRSNPYFDPQTTFLLVEEGRLLGFACGCTGDDLPLGDCAGYITCVVLSADAKTERNCNIFLQALEQRFQELGKKQAEWLFFNPMQLPWYIPDTLGHEHNNAPGVPVDSMLYEQLLNRGYQERARECAMYLDLNAFTIPADIVAKEIGAAVEGFHVELFDTKRHHGVETMLRELNNPQWEKEISQFINDSIPVLIASFNGEAVGFAGPVIRQDNGRGYFSGIGVHPNYEGHGLGSILFFRLCEAFKLANTSYMSLYTGSTNPARRIYEKAGFRTVKQFAVMRREFV